MPSLVPLDCALGKFITSRYRSQGDAEGKQAVDNCPPFMPEPEQGMRGCMGSLTAGMSSVGECSCPLRSLSAS